MNHALIIIKNKQIINYNLIKSLLNANQNAIAKKQAKNLGILTQIWVLGPAIVQIDKIEWSVIAKMLNARI